MDTRDLVTALESVLRPEGERIACAYLFGSHARGAARGSSDVDVAVLFSQEPPHTLEGLGLDLVESMEAAIGRRVDLVALNRAPPDLVHRVLRDGILIAENDHERRVDFEVKSRAEYFDVLPFLNEYRRNAGPRDNRR